MTTRRVTGERVSRVPPADDRDPAQRGGSSLTNGSQFYWKTKPDFPVGPVPGRSGQVLRVRLSVLKNSLTMMFIVLDCNPSKGRISIYNNKFYIASRGALLRTHWNISSKYHSYLRGGSFSRPELNEAHIPSVDQNMEEIRKFAKQHDLPIPSDDPKAVDPEVLRRLFPDGGDCGLDDPRVRYLAQVIPAVEDHAGSDQDFFLAWRMCCSITTKSIWPFIQCKRRRPSARSIPDWASKRRGHSVSQHAFPEPLPDVRCATVGTQRKEFLACFYPDLDK